MKLKLLGDLVLVKQVDEDLITKQGIILNPAQKTKTLKKGEVVGIGTGKLTINGSDVPLKVVVGDIIFYREFAQIYDKINIDGIEYFIMPESNIVGILVKEAVKLEVN